MPAGPPLVGRRDDVARLVRAVTAPRPTGAVVVGDAGVGKSRLVAEVLRAPRLRDVTVHRCVATAAAASVPYGALAGLLPDDAVGAHSAPLDVLRRTAEAIRAGAGPGGALLAVDDAHLLDPPSAALVHQVARTGAASVLVTVRAGAPVPDAVAALWLQELATRLDLAPLDDEGTDRLAEALLGGSVEPPTRRRLRHLSAGNPLLLRELVAAAQASGALVAEAGTWRATASLAGGQRLADLVASRLQAASSAARDALALVAIGEPLELGALTELAGREAAAEAEDVGLLTVTVEGRRSRVALAHPLYGEVLRAAAAPLRARERAGELATAIRATGARRRDDLLRCARWDVDAGGTPDDAVLVAAARRALALGDPGLAVRLGRAGVSRSVEAALVVAEALQAAGRAEEADALLGRLEDRVTGVDAARNPATRAGGLLSGAGRSRAARAVLDAALAGADAGPETELRAHAALVALEEGRTADAAATAGEVLEADAATPEARVRALLVAVPAWAQAGEADRACAAAAGALEYVGALPDAPATVVEMLRLGLCLAHGLAGRYDVAEALADLDRLADLAHVAEPLRAAWTAALGHLALARGDLPRAAALIDDAVAVLRRRPAGFGVYSLAWLLGCRAEVAAVRGDPDAAETALTEADAATPDPCFVGNRELGRIWTLAASGDVRGAVAHALAVADQAAARGNVAFEVAALHDTVRLGAARDVADRLRARAEAVDGVLAGCYAAHAAAAADGDATALRAASGGFEEVGRLLLAAEAAAEAAEAHRRAGRSGSANAAALRARTLASRCGGPVTPALVFGLAPRPLTAREREIAVLAARGTASRDIAERLVVSVRTVDNHLHRVYDKLGVAGRGELADALAGIAEPDAGAQPRR